MNITRLWSLDTITMEERMLSHYLALSDAFILNKDVLFTEDAIA